MININKILKKLIFEMKLTKSKKEEIEKEIEKLSKKHELTWCVAEEDGELWICASVDKQIAPKKWKEVESVKIKKV